MAIPEWQAQRLRAVLCRVSQLRAARFFGVSFQTLQRAAEGKQLQRAKYLRLTALLGDTRPLGI